MTIDINSIGHGHNKNIGVDKTTSHPERPTKNSQDNPVRAASSDTVTLTGDAEQLHRLEEAIQQTSGVDSKKVESIKTAIAEGRFEIDSDKIATKLIELEEQLKR